MEMTYSEIQKLKDFRSDECENYAECEQCSHAYECKESDCIEEIEPMFFGLR